MTSISWNDFVSYANEFLCEHCIDGLTSPSSEHDPCWQRCMRDWLNHIIEKANDGAK